MGNTLQWGLLLAAFNASLLLLGHSLGYQADRVGSGGWLYIPTYLGIVTITGWSVRAYYRRLAPVRVGFARGFWMGLGVASFGGLVAAGYVFLHFGFISVDYAEHLVGYLRTQTSFQSLPAGEAATVEGLLRGAYSPIGLALATPVVHLIFGAAGASIASAIWCRSARSGTA